MKVSQKKQIAKLLLQQAGNIVDHWDVITDRPELQNLKSVPADEAGRMIAQWLKCLPSGQWDDRLPEPK